MKIAWQQLQPIRVSTGSVRSYQLYGDVGAQAKRAETGPAAGRRKDPPVVRSRHFGRLVMDLDLSVAKGNGVGRRACGNGKECFAKDGERYATSERLVLRLLRGRAIGRNACWYSTDPSLHKQGLDCTRGNP